MKVDNQALQTAIDTVAREELAAEFRQLMCFAGSPRMGKLYGAYMAAHERRRARRARIALFAQVVAALCLVASIPLGFGWWFRP